MCIRDRCWAAEARAALKADPDAATRPFAAPEGWAPTKGALVRLRPGLDEKKGLRAGEVAAVTYVYDDAESFDVKRLHDGKPERHEMYNIPAADLVHVFDGVLPHAAAHPLAEADAGLALVEAAPAAAVFSAWALWTALWASADSLSRKAQRVASASRSAGIAATGAGRDARRATTTTTRDDDDDDAGSRDAGAR